MEDENQDEIFTLNRRPDIGIWGPQKAGKTMLLVAACRILTARIGLKDPDTKKVVDHYEIKPARPVHNNITTRHTSGLLHSLFHGQLPTVNPSRDNIATDVLEHSVSLAQHFMGLVRNFAEGELPHANLEREDLFSLMIGLHDSGTGKDGRYHILNMMDVGGQLMTMTDEHSRTYWQDLRQARSILFVVDGDLSSATQIRESYADSIEYFLNSVTVDNSHCDKYLAICITKADTRFPDYTTASMADKTAEELITNIIGATAYARLVQPFRAMEETIKGVRKERVKVFLTSATGWCQDEHGNWHSNLNEDGTQLTNNEDWISFQAAYPLLWLFDQIEEENIYKYRPWYLRGRTQQGRKRNSNENILSDIFKIKP